MFRRLTRARGAISAGSVYWGSGYCGTECFGTGNPLNNNKLYAFGLH